MERSLNLSAQSVKPLQSSGLSTDLVLVYDKGVFNRTPAIPPLGHAIPFPHVVLGETQNR